MVFVAGEGGHCWRCLVRWEEGRGAETAPAPPRYLPFFVAVVVVEQKEEKRPTPAHFQHEEASSSTVAAAAVVVAVVETHLHTDTHHCHRPCHTLAVAHPLVMLVGRMWPEEGAAPWGVWMKALFVVSAVAAVAVAMAVAVPAHCLFVGPVFVPLEEERSR